MKTIVKGSIYIFFIFLISHCSAQKKTSTHAISKELTRALKYKSSDPGKSILLLQKLHSKYPDHVKITESLANLYFDQQQWVDSYEMYEILISTHPKPIYLYRQGLISWRMDKYDKAYLKFSAYVQNPISNKTISREVDKYLKDLSFIRSYVGETWIEPAPIKGNLNTPEPEFLAVPNAEGNKLVFSRNVGGQEDLFIADKLDGQWKDRGPLMELNTPQNEGTHSFSADGKTILFTGCNRYGGKGSCDLYLTIHTQGSWQKPIPLQKLNSKYWDGHPSINSENNRIFFSSDRPGGYGGKDIWFTDFNGSEWSEPINAGPKINTSWNEESPFIHLDNKSLYFRSSGHPGFGGMDLFICKNADDSWSTPLNMGHVINSKLDEGAMSVVLDGSIAFFSRGNRDTKDIDIYQIELNKLYRPALTTFVKIKILNKDSEEGISTQIILEGLKGQFSEKIYYSDQKGEALICIHAQDEYSLRVQKKGFDLFTENIRFDSVASVVKPLKYTVFLSPQVLWAKHKPVVLKNIFYEIGKAELLPESMTEIKFLANFLTQNPEVQIEIIGHTDNIGSPESNMNLSSARADVVRNKLIEFGINSQRIIAIGYGEQNPISNNNSELGRAQNRRTEFRIIQ